MNNQERFSNAIRTSQVEGGGVYVEAQLAINSDIYRYGQHYEINVPEAVEQFTKFYYPLFVQDQEAAL